MRASKSTSRRQKPYADPVGRFARVLESHEAKIAHHTAIQSKLATWQLLIGALTTGALIYISYAQYNAADRQVALEYAKVAPQFEVTSTLFPTLMSESVTAPYPKDLSIRITRGEASLESVSAVEEFAVSRLILGKNINETCVLRLRGYFIPAGGNITDFTVAPIWKKIASRPSWFQDSEDHDFLIFDPQNTLVTIEFKDIFGKVRQAKFAGTNGRLQQLPSGDFSQSTIYETVEAGIANYSFRIPGSFRFGARQPTTRGCRLMFGLKDGKATFF